jgi:hypothetical protein
MPDGDEASWHETAFMVAYSMLSAVDPHHFAGAASDCPAIDFADPAVQQTLANCRPWFGSRYKQKMRVRVTAELVAALASVEDVQQPAMVGKPNGKWPQLPVVDKDMSQVRYNGVCHDCTSEGARMMGLMVEAYPQEISASANNFSKPSRVRKELPTPLQAIIKTRRYGLRTGIFGVAPAPAAEQQADHTHSRETADDCAKTEHPIRV